MNNIGMKRLFSLTAAVICAFLASCSGNGGDEGMLVISADKTGIQTGTDEIVTFTVRYGSEDVSTSADMVISYTSASGDDTYSLEPGVNTFSSTVPGSYVFTASYKSGGEEIVSGNSVEVTVSGEQTTYAKKAYVMQFTAVGCPNCPIMSTNLSLMEEDHPDDFVVAAYHISYNAIQYPDPMVTSIGEKYRQEFDVTGIPRAHFDMHEDRIPADLTSLENALEQSLSEKPFCGVAIESEYDGTARHLSVTAKVRANRSEVCRYLIVLVEDNIEYDQLSAPVTPYYHNNVVREVLANNIYGERFNSGRPLVPGVEYTSSRSVDIPASWNVDNMRIIVAVQYEGSDGVTYYTDNANVCRLGESADYNVISE